MSTQTPTSPAPLAPWQFVNQQIAADPAATQVANPAPSQPILGWIARSKADGFIVKGSTRRFSVWSSKTLAKRSARESHWPRLTEADLNSHFEFLPVTLAP